MALVENIDPVGKLEDKITAPTGASFVGFPGSVGNVEAAIKANFLNVKFYGAVGDGVADDTAAIQAALAAAANGGTVYFPAGVYLTSQLLDVSNKKMHLMGDGLNESVIRASAGMSALLNAALTSTPFSFNEFRVSGLQFDGNNLAQTVFNLRHRHYCSFEDTAFFNGVQYCHIAQDSWCNQYKQVVFGNAPVLMLLNGSNHRNSFRSTSFIGATSQFIQIVDGVDGNSGIEFTNCDVEFQNGGTQVNGVYIRTNDTISFNDCYVGESINGDIWFLEGSGSIVCRGGVTFTGHTATGRLARTQGPGTIQFRDVGVIGGTFASVASLGSQFGSNSTYTNCRMNFASLGVQTLAGDGLGKVTYPNPVLSYGKAWALNPLDGTASQSIQGTARTVSVTSPSTSGLMFLYSSLDQNRLSTGLGPSGRFARVVCTYQSTANANLYTANTVGGTPVNSLGALPASPGGKVCVVVAADITGGSVLEIGINSSGGSFTLFDCTVLDADYCTLSDAKLINLHKAQ